MRVLIVKTSSMGDVLHTLPAVTDAMTAIAGICFDWVAEEALTEIPAWHPGVDRVIPVAIRRWRKNWFAPATRHERHSFKQMLQERHYDAVIDAQGLLKSAALVTSVANGSKHGQDRKSAREPLASWFYDYCYHIDKQQHAVARNRELFAKSLGYTQPETEGDYAIAPRFVVQLPSDSDHYLIFLHATSRDDKQWPEGHWRQLIARITSTGLKIKLPWGAKHEYLRALRLAEGFPHVEVLPHLNLQQLATLLAGAKAVVSVDTGLSHLAAALNKPNITLFGPTEAKLIGGYGKNQYICLPEQGKKMRDIQFDKVFSLLSLSLD